MIQLSEHFALSELLVSQTAVRLGHPLELPPIVIANLRRLCVLALEPIRVALGRPIVVSSGWRPDWLNELIGGAKDSAHLTGRAADINAIGMTPRALARSIQRLELPVDKVILEFDSWVHVQVSLDALTEPRRQYLTAQHVAGRTQYLEGLMA